LYSIIIFISVLIGISLGQFNFVRENAELFIVPLLVAMLYITFLQIPISDIKSSFRNLKFTSTAIIMNFVWTPILAWHTLHRLVYNIYINSERKRRFISYYLTFKSFIADNFTTFLSSYFWWSDRCN